MKLLMYSGGLCSYHLSTLLDPKETKLIFCDTLIEHDSLYLFILQTVRQYFNITDPKINLLIKNVKNIPSIYEMDKRKTFLFYLSKNVIELTKGSFIWLMNGNDPWSLFKENSCIGNNLRPICSHFLKQTLAYKYVTNNYKDCSIYVGIDLTEKKRLNQIEHFWQPYKVHAPLMEDKNYLPRYKIIEKLNQLEIDVPELYELGFTHNNCGGFCVRTGQNNFYRLLKILPDVYKYHEEKEEELRKHLGKDVSIMMDRNNQETNPLTMRTFRLKVESGWRPLSLDYNDNGCGCFIDIVAGLKEDVC